MASVFPLQCLTMDLTVAVEGVGAGEALEEGEVDEETETITGAETTTITARVDLLPLPSPRLLRPSTDPSATMRWKKSGGSYLSWSSPRARTIAPIWRCRNFVPFACPR